MAKQEEKKYVNAIKTVKKVFNEQGIKFWIDYGTLIGALRDKKMIAWDWDMDVGVWIDDAPKIAQTQKTFQKFGYELYINGSQYGLKDIKERKHLVCILMRSCIDGYAIEINILRPLKQIIWMLSEPEYTRPIYTNFSRGMDSIPLSFRKAIVMVASKIDPEKRKNLLSKVWNFVIKHRLYYDTSVDSPVNYLQDFTTIKFYGEEFLIPKDYDPYLTFMYGNWRVPDKNFVWKNIRLRDVKKKKTQNIK